MVVPTGFVTVKERVSDHRVLKSYDDVVNGEQRKVKKL